MLAGFILGIKKYTSTFISSTMIPKTVSPNRNHDLSLKYNEVVSVYNLCYVFVPVTGYSHQSNLQL